MSLDSQFYPLTVTDITETASDAVIVTLAPQDADIDKFKFIPGQYLTFQIPQLKDSPVRCYSLCSLPSQPNLSIGVRKLQDGLVSSYFNHTLSVGDTLRALTPRGQFIPHLTNKAQNIMLLAAGSGITPMYPLIVDYLDNHPKTRVTLMYANTTISRMMLRGEFTFLKNEYHTRFQLLSLFDREPQEFTIANGRIDPDKLSHLQSIRYLQPLATYNHFYLCGPAVFLDTIIPYLQSKRVAKKNIHTERFINANQLIADTATQKRKTSTAKNKDNSHHVEITHAGATYRLATSNPEKSILDLGIEAGIDLPHSCKAGVCSTCKAKITKGAIRRGVDQILSEEEKSNGYVLTCQSFVKSAKASINYDDGQN